ncbi:MAG: glutamate 5-kinase [Deltaproteobacteria bacterium]|nr:glutamate 5-kinase [Deltaproteobacteria bacterium]MBI2500159.1 glutamate 5-kinase [Deltaproteobacteria bacterium]
MGTEQQRQSIIKKTGRVVIKIGSSVLKDQAGRLSLKRLSELVRGVSCLHKKGFQLVLVSSGAIASGMQRWGFQKRPSKISELQACASLGQPFLISCYQKLLARSKIDVAQLLLTRSDLEDRTRFLNAKHTLFELLRRKALPIINENDTVAVEEIRFGDNDNLAALTTNVVDADLLILLTDQDGLFTANPTREAGATQIPLVRSVDTALVEKTGQETSHTTVGGMRSKLEACRKAAEYGIPTIIANGQDPKILQKIFAAEAVGTLFLPERDSLTARKHWIAHTLQSRGTLLLDEGACHALIDKKKSLLPSGIEEIKGSFVQGDAVDICNPQGIVIGRGLSSYSSQEIQKIKGEKTSEIEKRLGYKGPDEVVHRDDLVLT